MLVVVVASPIFVNYLMFKPPLKFFAANGVETNNVWIGFFSSYLGSILGGLFGGLLTLGGVWLTIEDQKRREAINIYPEKRLKGDEVLEGLSRIDSFEGFLSDENMKIGSLKAELLYICEEQGNYLQSASKVSGEFYVTTREIIQVSKKIKENIESVINNKNRLMDNDYEVKRIAKISEIKNGSDLKQLIEKKKKLKDVLDEFISYHEKLIEKKKRSPINN